MGRRAWRRALEPRPGARMTVAGRAGRRRGVAQETRASGASSRRGGVAAPSEARLWAAAAEPLDATVIVGSHGDLIVG